MHGSVCKGGLDWTKNILNVIRSSHKRTRRVRVGPIAIERVRVLQKSNFCKNPGACYDVPYSPFPRCAMAANLVHCEIESGS